MTLNDGRRTHPGWGFCVSRRNADGSEHPIYDGWEDTFTAIVQYAELYTDEALIWLDEVTGEVVDLEAIRANAESKDDPPPKQTR